MADRLEIDGKDATDECAGFTYAVRRLVYDEDNGTSVMRFTGPQGFQLTLVNPNERLRSLVDGGVATHTVEITSHGVVITHTVQFHQEWKCADGTRKAFASLALDRAADAKWIPEPDSALATHL